MRKFLNISFIATILFAMVLGLFKTIVLPSDINEYENRYSEKMKTPTLSAIGDQSFQSSVENALADQLPYAPEIKKVYNDANTGYLNSLLSPLMEKAKNIYIPYNGLYIYENRLVHKPHSLENALPLIQKRAANINAAVKNHSDIEFYCYYIENDTAINFSTGEKLHLQNYLFDALSIPQDHCGAYTIDSFEAYNEHFYVSDHHWNHKGSYAAYLDLLDFLNIEDAPIQPQGEVLLGTFIGANSKSAGTTEYSDEMMAYRFDLPEMDYSSFGNYRVDYGHAKVYQENGMSTPSYGNYYGDDCGQLLIQNHREDQPNILIIGDSYDNALIALLATHYNNTHAVDLRYYEAVSGKPFNLGDYIEENDIDQVLLIGSSSYYQIDDFNLEG